MRSHSFYKPTDSLNQNVKNWFWAFDFIKERKALFIVQLMTMAQNQILMTG